MDELAVAAYITDTFEGVELETALGYTFFCYRDDHKLPFATLIAADNEYDRVSNLDRPGAYRLNIGVGKQTFQSLFGTAQVDLSSYDFTALNVIMPHPEYSREHFVCVLSPAGQTWDRVRDLLSEAHGIAARRHARQHRGKAA